MKVMHYLDTYLPLTCNWIYNHIVSNKEVQHIICSILLQNIDSFPINSNAIFCFNKRSVIAKVIGKIRKLSFDDKFSIYFNNILRREKIGLIHAHFGHNGFRVLSNKLRNNLPLVTSFYGADISQLPKKHSEWVSKYSRLFKHGDAFVVEGPHLKKQLVEYGCPESKIFINNLGVDLYNIRYIRRNKIETNFNVLIAGTFREKKGIPYALEAIGILTRKYNNIRIHLVGNEAGKDGDAEEKKEILSKIDKYKLSNILTMHGFVTNEKLHEIAQKCHIFLSPSIQARDGDNEGGCPVTITEMVASGMPIISTWHCDIPQVVLHGYNGYLADEKNVAQIVSYFEDLINNPNKIEQFGYNGRKHVEKVFDVRKQAQRLGSFYKKIADRRINA